MSSFSGASDAPILKDNSYASQLTLNLDLLEGITVGGNSQSTVPMEMEGEHCASTKGAQAHPELATTLPLSTTDVSFEGSVGIPLKPIGAPTRFYVPALT